jgi:hypothetical protein
MIYINELNELLSLYGDENIESFKVTFENDINNIEIIYSESLFNHIKESSQNEKYAFHKLVDVMMTTQLYVKNYLKQYGFSKNINLTNMEILNFL